MSLDIVLCPIELSAGAEREIEVAAGLCEAFGARLVLHHNLSAAPPGLSKSWEWDQSHQKDEPSAGAAEQRIAALMRRVPSTVRREAVVTHGPLATALLRVAETLPADLIVIGTHGASTEDHTSVTERLLAQTPCPVLALHDTDSLEAFRSPPGPERKRVVVPTDFSKSAAAAVDFALELARTLPLELHLVHVSAGPGFDEALERLARLIPAELKDTAQCHLRIGQTLAELDAVIDVVRPELIIMGTHVREFWGRLFTRDVARRVLRAARCPICFVPSAAATNFDRTTEHP